MGQGHPKQDTDVAVAESRHDSRGPYGELEVVLSILCLLADQSSERSVAISTSKHETFMQPGPVCAGAGALNTDGSA